MLCCRRLLACASSSIDDGGQLDIGSAEVRRGKTDRLIESEQAPQDSNHGNHISAEGGTRSANGDPALAPEAGFQTARFVSNSRDTITCLPGLLNVTLSSARSRMGPLVHECASVRQCGPLSELMYESSCHVILNTSSRGHGILHTHRGVYISVTQLPQCPPTN